MFKKPARLRDEQAYADATLRKTVMANTMDCAITDNIKLARAALERIQEELGEKPHRTLGEPLEKLGHMIAVLAEVKSRVDLVSSAIAMVMSGRDLLHERKSQQENPEPRLRNGFAGEAHTDEILVDVAMKINPKTGGVTDIDPLEKPEEGLEKIYDIHETITGSEYAKEKMVLNWPELGKSIGAKELDEEVRKELLDYGYVNVGGEKKRLTTVKIEQITALRAWVNPEGKLRKKWENGTRKTARLQRKKGLKT